MKIFIVFTTVLLCVGCESLFPDKEYPIYIKNSNSKEIYYNINYSHPDTLLPETKNNVYFVNSGEKRIITASTHKWSEKEFGKHFISDTLSIFFISADTMSTYSWEKIKNDYNILERREYSFKDMESMNWTITYP